MTPRRRLVAPLAAACLSATTLVLAPTAAHADPRTLRLVSTATANEARFAGIGGDTAFFASGGDVYRDGSATPVATGATLQQASASQALVAQGGLKRIDLATGSSTSVAPSGAVFAAASPDLSRVAYTAGGEVLVTGVGALPSPGSGPAFFAGADRALTTVYVSQDDDLYLGSKLIASGGTLEAISADGQTGYVGGPEGLFRLANGSLVAQPDYGFGGMSGDGRTAYLTQGDGIYQQVEGAAPVLVATGTVESVTAGGALIWSDASSRLHRSTGLGNDTVVSGTLTGSLTFGAESSTGRIFFTQAIETDEETAYAYESGAVTPLAPGAFAGVSPDGARAYLESAQALTAADTDAARDVYESALVPPVVVPPPTTPSAPTDTTPPAASVEGRKKQVLDKALEVSVACGTAEPCQVSGTGTLKVGVKAARGQQRFRLKAKGASVAAGAERVIAFKVPAKARTAARAALRGGGSAKARLKVTVRDAAGNERVIAFRVIAFRVIAFR